MHEGEAIQPELFVAGSASAAFFQPADGLLDAAVFAIGMFVESFAARLIGAAQITFWTPESHFIAGRSLGSTPRFPPAARQATPGTRLRQAAVTGRYWRQPGAIPARFSPHISLRRLSFLSLDPAHRRLQNRCSSGFVSRITRSMEVAFPYLGSQFRGDRINYARRVAIRSKAMSSRRSLRCFVTAVLFSSASFTQQASAQQTGCRVDLDLGVDGEVPPLGLIWKLAGPAQGLVVGGRAVVDLDVSGELDAGNFAAQLTGPIATEFGVGASWTVSALDFDWSGTGHFHGEIESNRMNGWIESFGGGFSFWSLDVSPAGFGSGEMTASIHFILDMYPDFPGDLNNDQFVGLDDLSIQLASFGHDAGGDIDCDGDTDLEDVSILLANYGRCAPLRC